MSESLDLFFLIIFHPSDAFEEIKRRSGKIPLFVPGFILLAVLAVRYLYVAFVHAPLADIKLQDTNILLEIARIILPILTYVVSNYAVTSILYGATKIRTIFYTVTYSFIPYILLTLLSLGVSQVLCLNEAAFYYAFSALKWVWIIALIFFSVMIQNDYSFKKTVGVSILSIIGVVLIWAMIILIIALSVQVITWFNEIRKEIVFFN